MIVYLDFETAYGKDHTLSKMTTVEYIRDPRFEIIGVGIAIGDGDPEWFSGSVDFIRDELNRKVHHDWSSTVVVAHNAQFDGAILEWILDIRPAHYLCTMMMSRVHHVPYSHSMALGKLAKYHGLEPKGTTIKQAANMRLSDFSSGFLLEYANYCCTDVRICRQLFKIQYPLISAKDRAICSLTVIKAIRPRIVLDKTSLEYMLIEEKRRKQRLLERCGILDAKELRSNKRFAEILTGFGIDPPMKLSQTTGKPTYAFAKTDEGFVALLEGEREDVRHVCEARAGVKTSLMETRVARFIRVAECNGGKLPWPLLFFGAHTGRFSGWDKLNLQNLPSRGDTSLRSALGAPPGHVVMAGDLSQIEARVTALLAGCTALVDAFAKGDDVYVQFAAKLYNRPEGEIDKSMRFVGKTAILGLQYQCGAARFADMLRVAGVDAGEGFAEDTVNKYRETYAQIKQLWFKCESIIRKLLEHKLGNGLSPDLVHFVKVETDKVTLPGGRVLYYPDIEEDDDGEVTYCNNRGMRVKLYGGKLLENIVQALAQLCVRDSELYMADRFYEAVGQLHDELIYIVPEPQVEHASITLQKALTTQPAWVSDQYWNGGEIPLDCEIKIGKTYADCK